MKIADKSRKKLQSFFREYFDDETFELPPIYIYIGGFTKIFTKIIKVHGITLGKRIFVFPELIKWSSEKKPILSERLTAHEIAHVLQYKKHGFIKFFYHYLKSFWKNLKEHENWDLMSRQQAYLDIPFEIEARDIEKSFVKWCEKRRLKK